MAQKPWMYIFHWHANLPWKPAVDEALVMAAVVYLLLFIIHHVAPSRTFKKCFQSLEHFATDCHASGNGSSPKSSSSSSRSARSAHVPPKELEVGRLRHRIRTIRQWLHRKTWTCILQSNQFPSSKFALKDSRSVWRKQINIELHALEIPTQVPIEAPLLPSQHMSVSPVRVWRSCWWCKAAPETWSSSSWPLGCSCPGLKGEL